MGLYVPQQQQFSTQQHSTATTNTSSSGRWNTMLPLLLARFPLVPPRLLPVKKLLSSPMIDKGGVPRPLRLPVLSSCLHVDEPLTLTYIPTSTCPTATTSSSRPGCLLLCNACEEPDQPGLGSPPPPPATTATLQSMPFAAASSLSLESEAHLCQATAYHGRIAHHRQQCLPSGTTDKQYSYEYLLGFAHGSRRMVLDEKIP